MHKIFQGFIVVFFCFAMSCSQSDLFEEKVEKAVSVQMAIYPKSTLQDIYKNFFQDRFGSGHAISDTVFVRQYLDFELKSFESSSNPSIESVGWEGNFLRVNLQLIKDGMISQQMLLDAFIKSAKKINDKDVELWREEWKKIVAIVEKMDLQLVDFENNKKKLDSLLKEKKYMTHHSDIFRETYQPHYRIVEKSIFEAQLEIYVKPEK